MLADAFWDEGGAGASFPGLGESIMGSSHGPRKAAGGDTLDYIRVISGCKWVLLGPLHTHTLPFALGPWGLL